MNHPWRARVTWALAGCLGAAGLLAQDTPRGGPPRDEYGRPTIDAQGQPIFYGRSESPGTLLAAGPPNTFLPVAASGLATPEWMVRVPGTAIGSAFLEVVDFDGDGRQEIVASASAFGFGWNRYWYVLEASGGAYRQTYASRSYPVEFYSGVIAQVDADPALELVIGEGTALHIIDGKTRETERIIETNAGGLVEVKIADLDADGTPEIVCAGGNALSIYNATTGALEQSIPAYASATVAIGNVDGDPGLEIVLSLGYSGAVLNGATREVKWAAPYSFGRPQIGDIDHDGIGEIVGRFAWDGIQIFDAEIKSRKATIAIFNTDAMKLADVDGDGFLEIIYGDAQHGPLHVLDGRTYAELWTVPNRATGATRIALGDADNNGTLELLWGSGRNTTGDDYLNVFGVASQTLTWKSEANMGPYFALDAGDVDADGRTELLYTESSDASDTFFGDYFLTIRDGASKAIEHHGPTAGDNWTEHRALARGNLDDDPQEEIVVSGGVTYTGMVICYDGLTRAEQWRATLSDGLVVASAAIADVDLDGQMEVAIGTWGEHTGAPNGYVYVFDGRTGAREWSSQSLGGTFLRLELLRVANLDGDPQPEILVGHPQSMLWILDRAAGSAQRFSTPDLTAIDVADIDRDGTMDVVGGTRNGDLVVLNRATLQVERTIGRFGSQIEAVRAFDFNGGAREFVMARGEEVIISDANGCILWRTGNISTAYGYGSTAYAVGHSDSLYVGELDGDDKAEIVVNVGPSGIDQYEVDPFSFTSSCGPLVAPSLWAVDAVSPEGQPGDSRFAAFRVFLSAPSDLVTRVKFSTVAESATAGEDYFSTPGTLVFAPGQYDRTIYVRLNPDLEAEPDETFSLILSEPSNAVLGGASARATIQNDDGVALSVSDFDVIEGDAGSSDTVFTVRLSAASPLPVSVVATLSGGTADPGVDYSAPSPTTLFFPPGVVEQSVHVSVFGDATIEDTESVKIQLSNAVNAVLAREHGTGWILTDDGPTISVSGVSLAEGYTGTTPARFRIRVSSIQATPVSVAYETSGGAAIPGIDFGAVSGNAVIPAGQSEAVIMVPVMGDASVEPNESFTLRLTSAAGATLFNFEAAGRILNDDGSTLSVTDAEVLEGTGQDTALRFTVVTAAVSSNPISVTFKTVDVTARAGEDYGEAAQTVILPPGFASTTVLVPVFGDAVVERDETLRLLLLSATGATIFDEEGIGTILADDGLLLSIKDRTGVEGDVGTTPLALVVSLNKPSPNTVTVDYQTTDGTATAPLDYVGATGTITFNPGETSKTVTVQVVGESEKEAYETFFVDLSNPTGGATIGDGRGQGTLTNTDGATDRSRLMFHNFVTNRLYRWHMKNGNTLDTFNWVTPWATDPGWTVGAVADFDQDGQLDYLWHNVNDGRLLFWYINGDNLKGFQFLPYTAPPPWSVAATFDADSNGTPDIVFYNSATSVVRVMRHDNATLLGQYDLTPRLSGTGTVRVVASVDANNDGDDELALYNSATGQVLAWDVNGANVTSTINYAITQSTAQAFNLVSTKTDFNNDGLADFLWHNPTPTGVFSVWFMNGTTRIGTGSFVPFTATDPVWRVVGSANVW